jgi:mono/diheme cytochrome c family protein
MADDSGADVSIDSFWRSTMMANAARDPYWQAAVRAEVLSNPEIRETIEDNCATCHMPMARSSLSAAGEAGSVLGDGFLNPENPLHTLAMDGVSCSLCHQIREDGLGLPGSFSGGFVIDKGLPDGERLIFGPYAIDESQAAIMQSASGYRPVQGIHITRSELCAACHTLYTPYVDALGGIAGEFPEQVPYLEWFYSDYRRTQACQDCHMPEAQGGVRIATSSDTLRSPFAQHVFVGGNAYMLEILKRFGPDLGVTAASQQFEATIQRTLDQLENWTASVTLEVVRLSGSRLTVNVAVESQVGHKFPTGFPSRRAWLRFSVRDAAGQVVFESGGFNPDGSIVGNDNDLDPTDYEPHYLAIVGQGQVQIYEAVLRDSEGDLTTTLLRAAGYLKDNRIPPAGYQKGAPYPDIAVRGRAFEDEDFLGGGDRIQYAVDLGEAKGPFTITVELLYQSVGYRWVENLRQHEAPEVARFLRYYQAVPNEPVLISRASVEVGP